MAAKLPLIPLGENRIWSFLKNNCRQRGVELTISRQEYLELAFSNCAYCGSLPKNRVPLPRPSTKTVYTFIFLYQGIDRKDNNLGYVPGNCVPCCAVCNSIKGKHLSHDEMFAVAFALAAAAKLKALLPKTQGPQAPEGSTHSPRKASRR
jgi:5-methylcytosine-specific restriction endonuclease McrA